MNRRELLLTAAAAAMLAAPYIARAAAPLTMRFAHFAQEDHPANIAAKQFASRVAERTNGAIRVMIFPNNQLGGPPEQAEQIKLGTIDMGLPTEGQLDKYDRAFGAVMLPFIFDNRALVFRVLDGPAMAWLAPLAEKQGFVLLRNWDYGFRNVTNSVRPIHAPEDVKGLKLRTPPELQIQASMEALGVTVQAIAFQSSIWRWRRGLSMARRTQSPSSTTTSSTRSRSTSRSPGTYNNMIHTIGVNAWKKLTPAQQTIFREESTAAGDLMRKLMAEGEADQIKKLAAAGMQTTQPNLGPFRALMEPAYKQIADYAGADNVKRFRDMVDQARKG